MSFSLSATGVRWNLCSCLLLFHFFSPVCAGLVLVFGLVEEYGSACYLAWLNAVTYSVHNDKFCLETTVDFFLFLLFLLSCVGSVALFGFEGVYEKPFWGYQRGVRWNEKRGSTYALHIYKRLEDISSGE